MYSTQWIKRVAATLTVGVLLAVAFAGAAQAGNGTPKGMTTQEWKAVQARSEAWNRYYHLGAFSKGATAVRAADERRAQATNRFYNLGTNSGAVRAADERRAQAVDRYFHLGSYAVIRDSSGFGWTDAGIGAGAMLGAIILAGGLGVGVRRRTAGKPSVRSTT